MSDKEFKVGDKVIYVPRHAKGDKSHTDCEYGEITSMNDLYYFVRYGKRIHSQATDKGDLIHAET